MTIHQLKATLLYIEPLIWGRFQVRSRTSLAELHLIVQWTMGWEHYLLTRSAYPGGGAGGRPGSNR